MKNIKYKVAWKRKATIKFAKLYNVDHQRVLRNTNHILSIDPYQCSYGVADFPDYQFNGYFWALINNVVLVYRVHSDRKIVSIEACYSALTGEVAQIFYGISPDDCIDDCIDD